MKSVRRTLGLALLTLVIFGIAYPVIMVLLATFIAPNASQGRPVYQEDRLIGYEEIGQAFNSPFYFWSRPSAVAYDASASGGSNLGPTNPRFLRLVQERIDTLMAHHSGLKRKDIPVDLVTASGSGLDPNISKQAALIQVSRIAKNRALSNGKLVNLVDRLTEEPLFGLLGPGEYVNVLKLNIELDKMK